MALIHKIVREDGSVLSSGDIKKFRFKEQRFDEGDLRLGGVISSFIDCTVYGDAESAVKTGEVLKYYQVVDGIETLVGTFNAVSSVPSKSTYSFSAYDNLIKLDVDFSERLMQIQDKFPMTEDAFVREIKDVAGLPPGVNTDYDEPDIMPPYEVYIPKFYDQNITCRGALQLIGEISGYYWTCTPSGELVGGESRQRIIDYWPVTEPDEYVSPTETNDPLNVYYKQNGLEYSQYTVTPIDCAIIKKTNGDVYAKYPESATENNPYIVSNVLVDNGIFFESMLDPGYENLAQALYESVRAWQCASHGGYRAATVKLFPFKNPFRIGERIRVTDIQGTTFWMPIMSMEVTDDAVVIKSTGNEKYSSGQFGYNNESVRAARESDSINKLFENVQELYAGKQNALSFDTTPTYGSSNPVTSDGVYNAINGVRGVYYGTCETGYGTGTKVVTCPGFVLSGNPVINVLMADTNTIASPTLNVNGTGAIAIRRYSSYGSAAYWWQPGEVVQFVYDGAYWRMVDKMVGNSSYYGQLRLSAATNSSNGTGNGYAATPSAVKAAYDRGTEGVNAAAAAQEAAATMARPNLLDNWYFANPVNQRGQTSYSGSFIYSIDRWIIGEYGAVSVNDSGMLFSGSGAASNSYAYQYVKDGLMAGTSYTLSLLFTNNTGMVALTNHMVDSGRASAVTSAESSGVIALTFTTAETIPESMSFQRIHASDSAQFIAAKLELGDTQTLAHQDADGNWVLNEIPNYAQELAKCQRYYQLFATQSRRPSNAQDFRPVMRATPALGTISIGGTTYYYADANL